MNIRQRPLFCLLLALLLLPDLALAASSDPFPVRFNGFEIVMTGAEPGHPDAHVPAKDKPAKWLVQFTGPVRAEEKRRLAELDCLIHDYLGDYAFLVTMTEATREQVKNLPFIRGSARYRPAYKIRARLREKMTRTRPPATLPGMTAAESPARLLVRVDAAGSLSALLAAVHAEGGEILDVGQDLAAVRVATGAIARLADLEEVLWIEEAVDLRLLNDTTRWTIQSYVPAQTKIWDHGLLGRGQLVGIGDTGLDYDMPWFHDPADTAIGPAHRKIAGYAALTDDYDGNFGHGTHVACTVAGDRTPVDGRSEANGMAPAARLYIQDITPGEQTAVYPPSDLGLLFITPYVAGARLHSDSWGAAVNLYETYARSADRFMWEHQDFLAFFANGNSGDGEGSVGTPATAKNVVSVGASENGTSGENVAVFSSNGPTADGRIKPTVTAPGVAIVSVDSDGLRSSFNSGTITYSGTSMATPAAAGAAALVRQYYLDGYSRFGTANPAYGFAPSAALIKATLLNSTQKMTGAYSDGPIPSPGQGWGRINLANTLHFLPDDNFLDIADVSPGLSTGTSWSRHYFSTGDRVLKATLVWTDYPAMEGAVTTLVNDLDLEVIAPDGTTYRGNVFSDGVSASGGAADRLNVEEQVLLPGGQAGDYSVRVRGANVPFGPQPFALVVTGGVSISAAGFIALDKSRYSSASTILVQVADRDLNRNSTTVEQAIISIASASEPGGEAVLLTESGANTSIFTGSLPAGPLPAVPGNGRLEIDEGDLITATYLDADDGSGSPATRTATAHADLTAPVISGVTSAAIGQDEATLSWTTDEPVSAVVLYGTDPSDLSGVQGEPWLLTSPVVRLPHLQEATTWFFTVAATDEAGNRSSDDNSGLAYSFTTLSLPPELTFHAANPSPTYQTETVLYGIARDPSGIASIRITGDSLDLPVICRSSDGYYELRVALALGDNFFTVTAADSLGNAQYRHLTVTRLEQPDLTVTAVTAPARGGFFQPIHLDTTICNLGPGASPGTGSIAWYLSVDPDIAPAEDIKLEMEYVHGDVILPGACLSVPVDIRLGIPLALVGKSLYLAAVVDSRESIWEAAEGNNIRLADHLLAIEGPDLAMTALAGPTRVGQGTPFTVANTVRNIGLGTSTPFHVAIYLSSDEVITTDDIWLGSRYVHSLEPATTPYPYPSESSAETQVLIRDTVAAGTYRLGAIAAPGATFAEPDKQNNVLLGHLIQVGDPDDTAPTVPQDLTAVSLGYNRVSLSWRAATDSGGTGVAGYRIFRDTLDIGAATATAYIDTGLVAATTYRYEVAAFDHAGNLSARSAAVRVTTGALPPGINLPPTLGGRPPERAVAGRIYDFVPEAADPNGDTVHFSISNRPAWAAFNETNGELSGVPGEEHVGSHGPITITVEDPYGESAALRFSIEVAPPAGDAGLNVLQTIFTLLLRQ